MTAPGKKNAPKTLVLDIKGNSLDDGPGIRSVIFFKGCPLNCAWCHNPESKRRGRELSFDSNKCIACDTCLDSCGFKALSRKVEGFIVRDRCTLCFKCVESCPSGALEGVGMEMTVDEIIDKVLRDKPFYDTSGGGVTLSGGEPALHLDFITEIMKRLKNESVHTLIETCGFFDIDEFRKKVLPHTDSIYFDIKILNDERHRELCGVSNRAILNNFELLLKESKSSDFNILPRTPLVPGMTATDENMKDIASYLRGLGVKKAVLLSYNPLWHEKSRKIGAADSYGEDEAMTAFMDRDYEKKCKDIFQTMGIDVV